MKTHALFLIILLSMLRANTAMGSEPPIIVEFDEFTGIQSVSIQPYTIKGAQRASIRGEGLWLRVAARYSTHEDLPDGVELLAMFIYATDRTTTLDRNHHLHLLIDGERLTLLNEDYTINPSSVVIHESLTLPLTRSELQRIAQATTIRARVGPSLEFEFPQALLSGFIEMREKINEGFGGRKEIGRE